MIFNRGNKLINTAFHTTNASLEDVKKFKYLRFSISAKNCSFLPTVEDLSIKATRVVYALNNKIKLSKLPTKLVLKLFTTLISPILLYGSEVWGPFIDLDFERWDNSKIEPVHIQFIKRILGCNFKTSNIMSRGELEVRPLLIDIIKMTISFMQDILKRKASLVFQAWKFESNNDILPNFILFLTKFNINLNDIIDVNKDKVKKICHDSYDRFWRSCLHDSPKVISYVMFKKMLNLKTTFRFRMSNHTLMVEMGRHMRPQIERNNRKCFHCKDKIENESHFVISCPLYNAERESGRRTEIYFIMSNECPSLTETLARFFFNSFKKRDKALTQIL